MMRIHLDIDSAMIMMMTMMTLMTIMLMPSQSVQSVPLYQWIPPTADPTSPEFSVNHCKISKVQYILHSEISKSQCTTSHTVEARFLSIMVYCLPSVLYHCVLPWKHSVCIIVCCLGSVAAWLQEWSPVSSPLNRLSMRSYWFGNPKIFQLHFILACFDVLFIHENFQ